MAVLTNLEKFRKLRIDDDYRPFAEQWVADGVTRAFRLKRWPVQPASYTALLDGVTQAETANYTALVNGGQVRFAVPPPSGCVVDFWGAYTTFSDDEASAILAESNLSTTAMGATLAQLVVPAIKVVNALMANAAKRHTWAAAGGQSVSEGQVFQNLRQLREVLRAEITSEDVADAGGIVSWSEEQQYWPDEYPR